MQTSSQSDCLQPARTALQENAGVTAYKWPASGNLHMPCDSLLAASAPCSGPWPMFSSSAWKGPKMPASHVLVDSIFIKRYDNVF